MAKSSSRTRLVWLMKLHLDITTGVPHFSFRPRAYCLADSDEESSSAGSSEEDDAPEATGSEKPVAPGAEG